MASPVVSRIVQELLQSIDIPESAYSKAERRYNDLGAWFSRADSSCARYSPHVYPQGSFRLGTVVRPIAADGEYDLDVGCRLRVGITKRTHSQRALKQLVGAELEAYRAARQIAEKPEERRRCWRLNYADELKFHLDLVPSIPDDQARRQLLEQALRGAGVVEELARTIAQLTGAVTDNQRANYLVISDDWRVSNSEGYARLGESQG